MKVKNWFGIALVLSVMVIIKSIEDSRSIEQYWNRLDIIRKVDKGVFPIVIESLKWYEGVLILNGQYYSMQPYCQTFSKILCFDHFVQEGDCLYYEKAYDLIVIERGQNIYKFERFRG
jgi:hypothetical protein